MAAAAMILLSTGASALGLGRVDVQSVLGETLRAEIEVTSLNADEAASLHVGLASPDAFKASGVEYNPVLAGATVTLSRRADGRPVLVLASDKVVQEPFVDVIVDFQWNTGRLTRSYTLLIDPPGRNTAAQPGTAPVSPVFASPPPAPRTAPPMAAPAPAPQVATALPPVAPPMPRAQAPAPAVPVARPPSAAPARATPAPRPRATPPAAPAPAPVATASATDRTIRTKSGDTLGSLASANGEPGVSLDQMLVSLYRNNPQAFVDDNMNRMKSGVTLAVPSADNAKQVSTAEAHQVIQAQSADFAAYRHRLASGAPTVHTDEGKRQASGKVEAQIRDQKTASAPPAPDKLTLSRGTVASGAAGNEAKISKDTQRQAEVARVAELSRNVAELKKLSAGTPAPAPAPVVVAKAAVPAPAPVMPALPVARPVVPAPASAPVAPPKPAAVPAPVAAPSAPASTASALASLPMATSMSASAAASSATAAAVAASAPVAASAVPRAASMPASAPSRPAVAPAPAPEGDGFLSTLTDTPYVIPGLVAFIALLAGFAFWRKRQGGRKFSGETSFIESKIQPDSFFGASGGQRVDTHDGAQSSASSSLNYSLSQLDAIGDVDPVAEADVYLAYGRDLQAEEILKEAQRSDPDRMAIRTKLLEVYAKRADLKTFEAQARQLHGLTGGQGEDWAKAQELGRQIDPTNPLYQQGAPVVGADTQPAPWTALPTDEHADSEVTIIRPSNKGDYAPTDFASTDLPIDFDDEPAPAVEHFAPSQHAPAAMPPIEMPDEATEPEPEFEVSDFNLDTEPDRLDLPAPTPYTAMPPLPELEPTHVAPVPAPPAPPSSDFDFGDLSLDLGTATPHAAEPVADEPAHVPELDLPGDADSEPMARKIELADEFRRIGDHEGARELLEEVVAKADGPLKARAQAMLDALG